MNDFVPDFSKYLNKLIDYAKNMLGVNVCVFMYNDILAERYMLYFDPVTEYSHSCKYCRKIQDIENKKLCANQETKIDYDNALKLKKPFVRKCFAGVNEAIIPFFSDGELSAIIKIGQSRTDSCIPGEICEKISSDEKSNTEDKYRLLPEISQETLLETANLIDYALKVFLWDNFVAEEDFSEYTFSPEKAKKVIDAYIWQSNFSVSMVAKSLNVTSEHLIRSFTKKYGVTVLEYLLQMRIKRAKFLLLNTTFSIKNISEKCGFSDANYFSRIFRKKVGISPGEYRKSFEK